MKTFIEYMKTTHSGDFARLTTLPNGITIVQMENGLDRDHLFAMKRKIKKDGWNVTADNRNGARLLVR